MGLSEDPVKQRLSVRNTGLGFNGVFESAFCFGFQGQRSCEDIVTQSVITIGFPDVWPMSLENSP